MAELALDYRRGHAFAGELDSVSMAELMWR